MSRSKNILFLSHYFPPEVNAPANRTFEHAKIWIDNGVNLTVITNNPHHPRGEIFPGYENRNNVEMIEGITVVRVSAYVTANSGFSKRILNYILFMLRAIWYGRNFKNIDLIYATSPQFFCGIAGAILSKILGKPFILEIRDIWPESIISVGILKNGIIIRALEGLEKWMVHCADGVVVVTEGIERHIRALGYNQVTMVPNGVLLSKFRINPKPTKGEMIVVAYFGTIGMAHNVENIVEAARHLKDVQNIKFIIAGDGSERENIRRLCLDLDNVTLYPLLSRKELLLLFDEIDVGIVSLKDNKLFQGALPSKMFEYLAMGKPVILSLPEGEATQLIMKNNCGVIIQPENDTDLVHAIKQYADDPKLMQLHGFNGRNMVEEKFNREQLALELLNAVFPNK